MTIRSNVLFRTVSSGAGWVTAATVPAGETWILKSASVLNLNAGPIQAVLQLVSADGVVKKTVFDESLANSAWVDWNGWLVLEQGDTANVFATGASIHTWASGAVLLGT